MGEEKANAVSLTIEEKLEEIIKEAEEMYFKILQQESDRGAILVTSSFLENQLMKLIKKKLIPCSKKQDPLFETGNAPLGTFSARIELAYRLSLIDKETKQTLNTFKSLRNKFAHEPFKCLLSGDVRDKLIASINHSNKLVDRMKDRFPAFGYEFPSRLREANPRILLNIAFSLLIVKLSLK